MTWFVIELTLSGMPKSPQALARAVWCGDDSGKPPGIAAPRTVARDPGLQWKPGGAVQERAMTFDPEATVDRYLDPDRTLETGRP